MKSLFLSVVIALAFAVSMPAAQAATTMPFSRAVKLTMQQYLPRMVFKGGKVTGVQVAFPQPGLAQVTAQVDGYPMKKLSGGFVSTGGTAKLRLLRQWGVWWLVRLNFDGQTIRYPLGEKLVIWWTASKKPHMPPVLTKASFAEHMYNRFFSRSQGLSNIQVVYWIPSNVAQITFKVHNNLEWSTRLLRIASITDKAQATAVFVGGKWWLVYYHFFDKQDSWLPGAVQLQ